MMQKIFLGIYILFNIPLIGMHTEEESLRNNMEKTKVKWQKEVKFNIALSCEVQNKYPDLFPADGPDPFPYELPAPYQKSLEKSRNKLSRLSQESKIATEQYNNFMQQKAQTNTVQSDSKNPLQ